MNKNIDNTFWAFSPEETAHTLTSDVSRGLSSIEAQERLRKNGQNRFGETQHFSKIKLFLRQFKSPLIFILIIAGTATFLLQDWFDAGIIFLAIGINTLLGFYQENRAENALSHLRSYIQERTRVIRDGHEMEVDAASVVVGDLIHLMPGTRIPADARLISVKGLYADEAILTGESRYVEKHIDLLAEDASLVDRTNMVFGGTLITEGSGFAMIVATGSHTEIGKIADLVESTRREMTPIQKAVSKLAWIIAGVVLVLVSGIFALGVYRGESVFEMFLVSIAVAVGAIPEALPIGLTAVLAVGVEQLARRKGIMRDLTAAETLGSTTVIMTDKTGTLTEAKMQLVDILSQSELLDEKRTISDNTVKDSFSEIQKEILYLASINTDVLISNPQDDPHQWDLSGNALEKNIVRSAGIYGINVADGASENDFQMVFPFNSKNKFSVSRGVLNLSSGLLSNRAREAFVVLGAPDVLLSRTNLSKDEHLLLSQRIEEMSESGKRILGVAIGSVSDEGSLSLDEIDNIEFVGVLAFYDPVRASAPEAIKKMEEYGVRVVIATGDIKGTAIAVARDLGWEVKEEEVLTGDELRNMDDLALTQSLSYVRIFARMTPKDKLRVARLYQKKGEVVAMTGDGVNDAPSLKAVDIGIAVGSGTDVAKGVADLVLLDDNFDVIVSAIEEGKRILRNIRKTFVYLLSSSLDEVILIGGSLLVGLSLPLTALQIIWVNFFTGSLPAIAFAFDEDNDLGIPEDQNDKHILNSTVKFLTIGIGVLTSALLFILYWGLMQTQIPEDEVRSFLFVCFASYVLFVAFSFRSLKRPIFSYNPFSNRFLVFGVAVGLFLLLATIYVPFLQTVFKTTSLNAWWMMGVCVWVVFNIFLVEVTKWFFYHKIRR